MKNQTNNVNELNKFEVNGQTVYQFTIDKYVVLFIEGDNYYSITNMVSVNIKYKALPNKADLHTVYNEVVENVKRAEQMNISATRLGTPYVR